MSDLPALTPETYINRELSFIAFNQRILALAQDRSLPLLERIKFLAIIGNNLDEFYMVRVSYYLQKQRLGIQSTRPDGYSPTQLLAEIRKGTLALMDAQREVMLEVLDELGKEGIFIRETTMLSLHEREALRAYFYEEVYPVLTPLAADYARPFPFISNLSLNLGVYLEHDIVEERRTYYEFVRIKVPEAMSRIVSLNKVLRRYGGTQSEMPDTQVYLWIEDVISDNLDLLFPGMSIVETYPFRLTRDADIDYEHEKDESVDMSAVIEEGLRERRFGSVVRLSLPENISQRMLERLIEELEVDPDRDVYLISGALGSAGLFELYSAIDRPDLKYPVYAPRMPEFLNAAIPTPDLFAAIRQGDILLHHPYDSFTPVEDFFRIAAHDPGVLAIKVTLYRVGKNSPIVQALMEARENDKQVAVLVELKARFDEENNLEWARALEDKGVHVTYGVEDLAMKTHAKIALVVRKEGDTIRRYVHLASGNYNTSTARLYTDIGLFTCHPEIGDDASRLFNRLTGYAPRTHYKRLLVAPEYLHPALVDLIDNEIQAAREGKNARLILKMNQLEEDIMIQKLYEASQAGVQIELIVRGLCCLRPGIEGLSENIRVKSILGRFLEHSRIYYFHNAPQDRQIYIGSADLMRRNLLSRVETVFPILDPNLQRRIKRLLYTTLRDNGAAWHLLPDQSYEPVNRSETDEALDSQIVFMRDSFGLEINEREEWWE